MPASVKSFRNSIREKLSLKSDKSKIKDPLDNKKPPIEYSQTDSEASIENKSIIDTIGSFSDAQSSKTGDKSESEDNMFTFKKLNNQGSLKQIKGEKGDGDSKSVKSRTSILSRLSMKRKSKKEESIAKDKLDARSVSTVKPSSIKSSTVSNKDGLKNIESASVKTENKKSDDAKSISSFRESIKSKISRGKKEDNGDNKSIKSSSKSILSKTKEKTPENTSKGMNDENKSLKSLNKSVVSKNDQEKSENATKDKNNENKSIKSSTKSTSSKSIKSKSDNINKKDKPILEEYGENTDDKKDTYSFKKITDPSISSKIFDPLIQPETMVEEVVPVIVKENVGSDNVDNIEPKVVEIVNDETNQSYPYSVKSTNPVDQPDKFEPVSLPGEPNPTNFENNQTEPVEPVVVIQNQNIPPIENTVNQNANNLNMNKTINMNTPLQQAPFQIGFNQPQIFSQPQCMPSFNPYLNNYGQHPLILDDLILMNSFETSASCLEIRFY